MAKYIIITCDSTSMISEAAVTGKPIYIAHMKIMKKNLRFKKFFGLFNSLGITKILNNKIEDWNYEKLDETNRVAKDIKKNINSYDFS